MAMSQTIDEMDHTLVTPAEIQWRPAPAVLPAGAQGAVLYGDPTKDGLFAMRFKLPKGYRVAPHTLSKAGDLHRDLGDLSHRDGREDRSEQGESHASGKLHRASARQSSLRVGGRGDGGSTQQYRTVGAHLHRREGRPAPEAEVTLEE